MKKYILSLLILALSIPAIIAQDLYDLNTVTQVEIVFEESNWENILEQYYTNDTGERLLATVTINGEEFDSVGVRYKGNVTYSPSNGKNPLNIKLDHIKNHDYDDYETIKLTNGQHDPSFVREVLSYKIARQYMVVPLSNYAKVSINGLFYGVFSSSENIGSQFQKDYLYAKKNRPRIKCNNNNDEGLFAGSSALNYLNSLDSVDYYDSYNMDSDTGWADLVNLIDVITNDPADVENVLDMDKTIWMLAFNNVVANMDSYTARRQNYYMIVDDNAIFNPVLWDLNESLGAFEYDGLSNNPLDDVASIPLLLHQGNNNYPLLKLILGDDRYRKMYVAHCKTILEENFVNGEYITEGNQLQAIINPDLIADPNKFYSMTDFANNMTETVNAIGNSQKAIGITELMEARTPFLLGQPEMTVTAPTIVDYGTDPAIVPHLTSFTFTATVNDATEVFVKYRFDFDREFITKKMFDDGANNDGAAGDGVYGTQVFSQITDIHYYFYADNADAGKFSPERAAHEYYNLDVMATIGDVVINEFLASNNAYGSDQDGEYDDWVELYNTGSQAYDLSGHFLSDDGDLLEKWEFPQGTTIAPDGYLIIWCDSDQTQTGLHTNFKLSAGGEHLFFIDTDGATILDDINYNNATQNISTGRYPNGTGPFGEMEPTHNANNGFLSSIENMPNNDLNISIYPNPARDILYLDFSNLDTGVNSIAILNTQGKMMYQVEGNNNAIEALNVSQFATGIYFISVQTDEGYFTSRVVVGK
ncbi:MAG: hypothetical protein ACI94Y_001457 [Maribacter sp.]|jgi:hypothetical protein